MILVFLASIRSTLVTAVSIPLSVVLALIVLWTRDLSLNMLTLGALTIAIGRVVDDSIVVLENIKRHLGYGEERHAAIVTAVKEVAGAVTSATLTTVAVFLPIGLVGGMVGQLFGSFSLTVTAALLASLVVSLTVVPVLSYWFLRPPKGTPEDAAEAGRHRRGEGGGQPAPAVSSRSSASPPAAGSPAPHRRRGAARHLRHGPAAEDELFRRRGAEVLTVKQELAPGTSLEAADEAARKVEQVLGQDKAVKDYQVTVGSSGFMAASSAAARAPIRLPTRSPSRTPPTTRTPRTASTRPSASSTASATPPSRRATASAPRT
ncbi:efflux RND transporter permease subunit [Streptomyces californicus]